MNSVKLATSCSVELACGIVSVARVSCVNFDQLSLLRSHLGGGVRGTWRSSELVISMGKWSLS